MTVRAESTVELRVIPSQLFLPAVTSMTGARAAAEATTRAYLELDPGSGPEDDDPDRAGWR